MHRDPVPCLACDAPVPPRTRVCPDCDYDVSRHDRRRRLLGVVGTALALSVVLAPLGIPLLWLAHRHRLAAEGTVSQRADVPVAEHLASVMRGFVSLERRPMSPAAFRRGGGTRAPVRRPPVATDRDPYR